MLKNVEALLVTSEENQRYLTGFTGSTGILVVTAKKAYLFTNLIYALQAEEETKGVEIVAIPLRNSLLDCVVELIRAKKYSNIAFEEEDLKVKTFEQLKSKLPQANFIPFSRFLHDLRAVKSQRELKLIKKAAQIAKDAFDKVKPLIKPGIAEKEIADMLEHHIRKEGGHKSAFDIIVASGVRSAFPHGKASDKIIKKGELVKIDFGVFYHGYNSDVTRTLVIGQPTKKQDKIIAIVQKAQRAAIAKVKDGVKCGVVDQAARSLVKKCGYEKYFTHGLGHGIGLSVHEYPRLAPESQDILRTGMVVTVEPGLYIPGWGGVRIEDMVLVTTKGCELLTR